MKNKIEVLKRLLMLADYFKETISGNAQEVYLKALDIYSDEQVFKAIEKAMFNQYFPRLHAFKEIIEGDTGDNALEQWEYVLSEINRVGINAAKFDEPTTRAINACGGIDTIGHMDRDKLTFKAKDFVLNYKVIAKNEPFKAIENKKFKELAGGIGNE